MKDRGMSKEPDTNFVLPDVEEEQKQAELIYHSEKLTIAYGILCMPNGTPPLQDYYLRWEYIPPFKGWLVFLWGLL
ncbi:pentatricopeptide repeat-containing protein, partial [Quercus suber]